MITTSTTLTLLRKNDAYVTVELVWDTTGWVLTRAIDEDGGTVTLTAQEHTEAIRRAVAGEDETGR